MKLALILLYDALIDEGFVWGRDFAFLANIHDEFQISARPEVSQRIAEMAEQSINDAGTRLNMRIPLRGSAAIGSNWKETH
jgi:DNA polymerase I